MLRERAYHSRKPHGLAADPMSNVPFSRSAAWTDQITFFQELGIEAWHRRVPYQVTNHLAIASSYAHILWAFMRECRRREGAGEQPFHLVELGAGSGRFGFYLLKQLTDLAHELPEPGLRFRYLMTDMAPANIGFLRQHPALRDFVAEGVLDFACFNPLESNSLPLRHSDAPGSTAERPANPVIFLGNYFFDSLPVDLFRIGERNLEVAMVDPDARIAGSDSMNKSATLREHGVAPHYQPVRLPYYDEPEIDAVLRATARTRGGGYIAFPIAGLRCLKRLHEVAAGRLLMVTSDKGALPDNEAALPSEPRASVHGGAVSFSVDFPVLARYVERLGGCSLGQASQQNLCTVVLNTAADWQDLPATRAAAHRFLDLYGHYHLYSLFALLRDQQDALELSAPQLLSFFSLVQWDPRMVVQLWPAIRRALRPGTELQRSEFARGLERSAGYHYHLPAEEHSVLDAAIAYFRWLGETEKAEAYARQAREHGEAGVIAGA
jgi:hypothetical protein